MARNAPSSGKVAKAAKSQPATGKTRPGSPCKSMQTASKGIPGTLSVKGKTPAKIASQAEVVSPGVQPAGVPQGLARILRPQAAMRWTLPMLATITPQYVEMVLRSALTGDHVRQWELFDLMLDTWPELTSCQQELTEDVVSMKASFQAFAEEGDPPTPVALEKQKLVSTAMRRMRPDPCADENDLDDTLKDILDGWFRGVVCLETDWHNVQAGKLGGIIAPRATFWAHPNNFVWNQDGRLMLRAAGGVVDFPKHKFLVGIHKAKSGSALGGALLRPLAWWWCAANFASDWLLNLAQIFGLPFRWANHSQNASQETVDAICNMLQNMGSAGWAAFPEGTTLELKDTGKTGDHSPQGDLLDRADRYARMLVLGQTMSGSQDSSKGGGKAFGAIEAEVKNARRDSAAKYACKVINTQLIPSIVELNYGNDDECPILSLGDDDEAGLPQAQRDTALAQLMPLSIPFLRDKYDQPEPGKDEESTQAHVAAAGPQESQDPVLQRQIAYATWKANQKSAGLATGNPPDHLKQAAQESGDAPAPDEKDISAKLEAILLIDDDAVFAKTLRAFTDSISAKDQSEDGHWVTHEGRHLFIPNESGNSSTKGSKKSKIPQRDGQSSTTTQSPSHSATDSRAGRAAEDELARNAGTGDGQSEDLSTRFRSQDDTVYKLWEKNRDLRREPNSALHIGTGSEHIVERFGSDRVMKHSKGYGIGVDFHEGQARLRDALPNEYIQRLNAQNHVFGDDSRIEGFTSADHHLGFAVSQRHIAGTHPSAAEMESFLGSHGFSKVDGAGISNSHIADKTWFDPKSGYMVSDAKPDNFIKTKKGDIVPVDLIVQHEGGTDLGKHLTKHLK